MDKTPLYQEIAESIRNGIVYGRLQPGDPVPTVRAMAEKWNCSPGTVQRAYHELAAQGLISGRPGTGTVIAEAAAERHSPLRQATLVNETESFLLRVLAEGYAVAEVERALQMALDRWRTAAAAPEPASQQLAFVGSHDPAVALIAARLAEQEPGFVLDVEYAGSLGGLIALARHEAHLAGSHLWDEETNTYNRPFVEHLLPGRRVALLRLADRRLGLIMTAGNPRAVRGLQDLNRPEIRFVNRQEGAGTRVWLEAQLARLGIRAVEIQGYEDEALTHSEVARRVADGRADVAVGIEAAALAYGLDFLPLTTESYDLVIPGELWERRTVQALYNLLQTEAIRGEIAGLGGYDVSNTGAISWVE